LPEIPYMNWYPRDWRSDPRVDALEIPARYGYFEILNSIWLAGGVLPDDDKTLCAASRLTKKLWARHRESIMSMLAECRDGDTAGIPQEYLGSPMSATGVSQKRLLREYEKAANVLNAKSRGGKTLKRVLEDSYQDSTQDSSKTPRAIAEAKNTPIVPKGTVSDLVADRFGQFWEIWVRKDDRAPALKAFKAVVESGTVGLADKLVLGDLKSFDQRFERLMAGTDAVRDELLDKDKGFRPLGATWIRSLRWVDAGLVAQTDKRERMAWEDYT